ncbi:MAG TPA: ATP-binding protein [Dinghuibacter sp.]|uniref:ATP-binding protein n=1 Tax=Dinghuibacter sp. TaxID=2024697 RepID=UPI002C1AEE62|nr:ATP-binding protein [Dinghuibacter sp.]HTJ14765.1 ATP-binding protein [Dinghuibacter sp.]
MKHFFRYIWWGSLCFFCTLPCSAQTLQQPQRVLTTGDGLPQSYISGLVQDSSGFVWIATRDGLARYDGARFKVFHHSSRDSNSFSSNVLISMVQDSQHRIWVESQSGDLDRFEPATERVERVTHRRLFKTQPVHFVRRGWLVDWRENLWCIQRAGGLYRYDWRKAAVIHYTRSASGLLSDTLRGLLADRRGRVWVVSQHGLSVFDTSGRLSGQYGFPFIPDFNDYAEVNSNQDDMVGALHERPNGEIMLGDRHQLIFFDPRRHTFRTVPVPARASNGVRWIQTGPDGLDYLVADGVVYRYSDTDGLKAIGDIGRPELRIVESFLVDRTGMIWLGTNAAGIHLIDVHMPFFDSHPTRWSFHYDVLLNTLGLKLDRYFGWPSSESQYRYSSYYIRSAYDARGRMWIGQGNRVGYWDTLRHNMWMLPDIPGIGHPSDYTLGIRGVSFSPDGRLWVVGDNGYAGYYDSVKKTWTAVLQPGDLRGKFGPQAEPTDMVADRDTLWISTVGAGLLFMDINMGSIRQLDTLLPTNMLIGLQSDPRRSDVLWVGTYEGLVRLDKHRLSARVFTTEDQLPDNTMYILTAGRGGYLWLGTNKGLCRFDPVTFETQTYEEEDGLPGDEFNRFHYIQLPDGRLAFGGTDGWTIFNPRTIRVDDYQTPVAFSDLEINNQPVHPVAGGILSLAINEMQTLRLPTDKNSLTFYIAGLEYNRPQKLIYRYQLVGYNDHWVQVGNTPMAVFTKLPPGDYTLLIDAANITGRWSPLVRKLHVIIAPPFWRRWWMFIVYGLLAMTAIWQFQNYADRRQRFRQEMLLKEREAGQLRQLDEVKSRFFSDITHELRTPLTLILTPAQQLSASLRHEPQRQWVEAIERNAHRLLRLIDQLLDFSKIESGSLKLHETAGDLAQFLGDVLRSFQHEADAKGIGLQFSHTLQGRFYWFDADKLEQVITNLLSNALKFTDSGGRVELFASTGPTEGVRLIVRDTGRGVPQEHLPFIFRRYYRVEEEPSNPRGSGIGLSLVRELVEWQGGKVKVASPADPPWKTAFTLDLPYRVTAPVTAVETVPVEDMPKILLVEDNPELAGFIADSLPPAYHILHAANGREGLDVAIVRQPDLIVSDVLMPIMDGIEFCAQLKHDERISHIPVILLTARTGLDSRLEGLSGGADDYLTKPFHIQELQLRVANLLKRQHLQRERLQRELTRASPRADTETSPPVNDPSSNIFLQKIYTLLEENLEEPSFGVESLSARMAMSRANLHRKVKSMTGLAAGDLIRNYRLQRAGQFLREGFNSSETAYKVGFSSPAYFSKCFREFYDVTPMAYTQAE